MAAGFFIGFFLDLVFVVHLFFWFCLRGQNGVPKPTNGGACMSPRRTPRVHPTISLHSIWGLPKGVRGHGNGLDPAAVTMAWAKVTKKPRLDLLLWQGGCLGWKDAKEARREG